MNIVYNLIFFNKKSSLNDDYNLFFQTFEKLHTALAAASAKYHYEYLIHYKYDANFHYKNNPSERKMIDGSIRWEFIDDQYVYLAVCASKLKYSISNSETDLNSLKENAIASMLHDDKNYVTDYPYDKNLPGGWVDGAPIFVKDIKNEAISNAALPSLLNEKQKFALVYSRIKKRPNFNFHDNYSGIDYDQAKSLALLDAKDPLASVIIDYECNLLEVFYKELYQD